MVKIYKNSTSQAKSLKSFWEKLQVNLIKNGIENGSSRKVFLNGFTNRNVIKKRNFNCSEAALQMCYQKKLF